jgi:hypothetical protein
LERLEVDADGLDLGDLDARPAADWAASAFTLDKMDCTSGATAESGLAGAWAVDSTGREAGAGAWAGTTEETVLGEGAEDTNEFVLLEIDLIARSSSTFVPWSFFSNFGNLPPKISALGEVNLGDLEDSGLSSSSSGGSFTVVAFGETTTGVLGFDDKGTSSSSLGGATLMGAALGEVALRGDATESPFMEKATEHSNGRSLRVLQRFA